MKLLHPTRWILGSTLAALLAAGCGATDGTGSTASAQLVASPTAPGLDDAHGPRRGPPDPARMAQFLDRNHDGRLEVAELPERARERLGAADADHDGLLSTAELTAHFEAHRAQRFARQDADGDGALSAAEVPAERWAHMQVADADRDGRVTRAELDQAHASGALRPPHHGRFGRGHRGPPDPARFVEHFDQNHNGTVELAELPPRFAQRIGEGDTNHDGALSLDEIRVHMEQHRPGPGAAPTRDEPAGAAEAPSLE